jgi:uncharacterized protein
MDILSMLSEELKLSFKNVENTVKLIDEGNTIPFIARYRKELTGAMDDQVLRELSDRLAYLRSLEKRKQEVAASIEEQGKMTGEIKAALGNAKTLSEVEDIYRPYKPKRKTRASVAREKGLEPLALTILKQMPAFDPVSAAKGFIDPEKGVETAEDALSGASDIIAEIAGDDAKLRKTLREYLVKNAVLETSSSQEEPSVYSMYYDFKEPVAKIAGHRVLAIDRGEREEVLKVKITADENALHQFAKKAYVTGSGEASKIVEAAVTDGFDRLIFPSLEREIRNMLTDTASEQAIKVFSLNLKHLLLQPPVKNRIVLGLDPAYRTGCKIAVVDETGKVLHTTVVYPTPPQSKTEEAARILTDIIRRFGVTVIAIGNGTASRESEEFVAGLIAKLGIPVSYMVVSEAGASVYSASKLAAEEFPDYDVSLRSAVSIARRLQDPLAELVKIDPKAIGVGQYQHDMPKNRLSDALSGVVEDCVNSVGVDVNTASHSLLSHIAGVNASIAKNIVAYREKNGRYQNRMELQKVDKLGKKAFEQCAGFLRVAESENVLDNTAVHPESYTAAKKLLTLLGYSPEDLKASGIVGLKEKAKAYGADRLALALGIGLPTLSDIIEELLKPGRDVRDSLPPPLLRTGVLHMEDLKPGMALTGTVRNVIDFGVFVDIGVHEDGLVHISQLADRYVKHPSEVVKVGDIVNVKVLDVDVKRKRISLTMKNMK